MAGRVVRRAEDVLVVRNQAGKLQVVLITSTTVVKKGAKRVKAEQIAAGDRLVVVGRPMRGKGLEAKAIVILPPPQKNGNPTARVSLPP